LFKPQIKADRFDALSGGKPFNGLVHAEPVKEGRWGNLITSREVPLECSQRNADEGGKPFRTVLRAFGEGFPSFGIFFSR
jgi:hypothetical protein